MGAMIELAPSENPILAWGLAGAALEGESGDLHAIVPFKGGILVAVIDGLGHGPEAAEAARAARGILEECAGDSMKLVFERCHEGIRHTRGVVMSAVSFDVQSSSITWMGVGNVEGILLRRDRASDRDYEAIHNRGGVVGYRLPPLSSASLVVGPGDLLIMATDGIRSGFIDALRRDESAPDVTAARIMSGYRKESDDALVVVARYLGGPM
jgi:serine/threonine protein phosphatase PrpC